MENIKFPVWFTTFYLLVYALLSQTGVNPDVIIVLFTISPFLVVWMVICVLKNGKPSQKKFDDGYWYDEA